MKENKRLWLSLLWLVLGSGLIVGNFTGLIDDFWNGMGFGFVGIGIVQMIRLVRYKTNAEYCQKVDISNQDERIRFLSARAWAWAGYLFVMIGAVGTIVLRIMGRNTLSTWAAGSICLIMVLYWVNYMWLSKKY